MKTKFTPGPWRVEAGDVHVFSDRILIAGCGAHSDNFTPNLRETQQANARLIAAAPDLLAERDRLRAVNTELVAALEAMRKACDEWAAEFTLKKRGMDWGVVNDAYVKCSVALANHKKRFCVLSERHAKRKQRGKG